MKECAAIARGHVIRDRPAQLEICRMFTPAGPGAHAGCCCGRYFIGLGGRLSAGDDFDRRLPFYYWALTGHKQVSFQPRIEQPHTTLLPAPLDYNHIKHRGTDSTSRGFRTRLCSSTGRRG